jgi:hypothetical protein
METTETSATHHVAFEAETMVIYGTGASAAEALADAREWVDRDSEGNPRMAKIETNEATPALVEAVRTHGGRLAWLGYPGQPDAVASLAQ